MMPLGCYWAAGFEPLSAFLAASVLDIPAVWQAFVDTLQPVRHATALPITFEDYGEIQDRARA